MSKLYRICLVLGILMLTIVGLNTCNQGINSLTLQNRRPVLGWQSQGNTVSVFTLGESHSYGKEEIVSEIRQAGNRVLTLTHTAAGYFGRIVNIFKAHLIS